MATHDVRLWRLHLRRSLGDALTADEQSDLNIWYAQQDQAEALALGPFSGRSPWVRSCSSMKKRSISALLATGMGTGTLPRYSGSIHSGSHRLAYVR